MRVRTTANYLVIALAAVLAAAVLAFRSVSSEAVYPVENANRSFLSSVKTRLKGCVAGFAAAAENRRLKRELAELSVLRGDFERLESENDHLRAELGFAKSRRGKWVVASVLSRDGASAGFKPMLRVNKGMLDGIVEGSVAVVPEGLVGLVTKVSPHTAEVMPIVDSAVKVDCEIEIVGDPPVTGILSGGSEEMLLIKYLKGRSQIPPRSRVLTSGRGGVFPRGIEIGTFKGVREDASGLLREGEVLPGVDFKTLEDLFIRCEK